MSQQVEVALADGVLTVRLCRPEKKNAVTNAMYGIIADALERAERDPAVRAVLIEGAGDSFCAGNDIADFAAVNAGPQSREPQVGRMLKAFAYAQTPIVAAVQGVAVGIGCTMLLHCDLIFVAEDARLSTPFVNLALVPEAASSLLIPARIGHARAFEMFALGAAISGREAVAMGLANLCVPSAELRGEALEAARNLAGRPRSALRATKRLMRDPDALWRLMEHELSLLGEQLRAPEAREAFAAFAERRKPDFSRIA